MNKFHKTIAWVGAAVILVAGVYLFVRYRQIATDVFAEKKGVTISYVQSRAAELVRENDFDETDPAIHHKAFEDFFGAIQSPEIFRVKVFNREPKIVWSNLKEIIGDDASQNQDVRNALERGVSIMKFKSAKPEQISERQFTEFTETYVPIQNRQGQYIGVIEVYQTNVSAKEKINTLFQKSLISTFLLAVIGWVVFAFVLRLFMPRRSTGSDTNSVNETDI